MRDRSFYVSSLLELGSASAEERRGIFRQAMAALSTASAEEGPSPLEGLNADVLVAGIKAALTDGLFDDLDFLAPQSAGVALYTLAAALPVSPEQRELGRRVLARMLAGDADTFTAMATVMAQTSGKGLSSAGVRARVALVCELPLSAGIADGPLALALVRRRELSREWIVAPSTRSLPARRLAARILERAAREAAKRAETGDLHAVRVFESEGIKGAWSRLLADRESLVFRYVAAARGLLAPWIPAFEDEIGAGLGKGLSPTEYRRATTSLAAIAAVRPEVALKITQGLVRRGFFESEDRGSTASFVWGLPRVVESEPDVASELLDVVLPAPSVDASEAIFELLHEHGPSKALAGVVARATEALRRQSSTGDDGADALRLEIARDLENAPRDDRPLRAQVAAALAVFAQEGAPAAFQQAREVLAGAEGAVEALEAVGGDDEVSGRAGQLARRTSMAVLRDLDASLLERHVVGDLLKLGGSADAVRGSETTHDALRARLAEWIVARETPSKGAGTSKEHTTLRLRRLRALLHLLDGILGEGLESGGSGAPAQGRRPTDTETGDFERAARLRTFWLRTVWALLEHFKQEPPPALRRTMLATVARALDALVRIGACDPADALLLLARRLRSANDFETLAEASMDPDLEHVLARYGAFLRAAAKEHAGSFPEGDNEATMRLAALADFTRDLGAELSARGEALRTVLVRLHGALALVARAPSVRALETAGAQEPDAVVAIETWAQSLAQMTQGARTKFEVEAMSMMPLSPSRSLSVAVTRVLRGAEAMLSPTSLEGATNELCAPLPFGFADVIAQVVAQLGVLPVDRPSAPSLGPAVVAEEKLPDWVPARRTMGGFYVQRALGGGGAASVFVVCRIEERGDPSPELFALKVPEYNATAARSVSQDEFTKLFREEASALIGLPAHPNLARFVTFDVGTKPLPILVTELVEGAALERVVSSRTFDMTKCVEVLDGILAGLTAMHAAGIGHLDLKPSNVVLRKGEVPVLVDFGLAGRKLRPGCGTGPYGAPEVWGLQVDGATPTPMAADIYSFGCLAFELITGQVLFDAPNEIAQVGLHVAHDGNPEPMKRLLFDTAIGPLAEALVGTLRRDPRRRPSADQLRRDLRTIAPRVAKASWPRELAAAR